MAHDRAEEYALCTRALKTDHEQPGAEAIFDQALTNGVAAIVARRWPGEELDGNKVKSAAGLLDVIEAHGRQIAPGVVELDDLSRPPPSALFGNLGSPTRVELTTLRSGIAVTQPRRHARANANERLSAKHVEALALLNVDDSLDTTLDGIDIDQHEEQVALADAVERTRARRYRELLYQADEWDRRETVDYVGEYTQIEDHEQIGPVECSECGLEALVPDGFDSYLHEFAYGTCAACSYAKDYEVADLEGRNEAIDRAVADPRR